MWELKRVLKEESKEPNVRNQSIKSEESMESKMRILTRLMWELLGF